MPWTVVGSHDGSKTGNKANITPVVKFPYYEDSIINRIHYVHSFNPRIYMFGVNRIRARYLDIDSTNGWIDFNLPLPANTLPEYGLSIYSMARRPNQRIIAIGKHTTTSYVYSTIIYYSDDEGSTWAYTTIPLLGDISELRYDSTFDLFVCAVNNGLYTSSDGISWANRHSVYSAHSTHVCCSPFGIVRSVGSNSSSSVTIYYSSDYTTWTASPLGVTLVGGIEYTQAYGDIFVLSSRDTGLYSSTTGQTWTNTLSTTLVSGELRRGGGGGIYCFDDEYRTFTTFDGTNWSIDSTGVPYVGRRSIEYIEAYDQWIAYLDQPYGHLLKTGDAIKWSSIDAQPGDLVVVALCTPASGITVPESLIVAEKQEFGVPANWDTPQGSQSAVLAYVILGSRAAYGGFYGIETLEFLFNTATQCSWVVNIYRYIGA